MGARNNQRPSTSRHRCLSSSFVFDPASKTDGLVFEYFQDEEEAIANSPLILMTKATDRATYPASCWPYIFALTAEYDLPHLGTTSSQFMTEKIRRGEKGDHWIIIISACPWHLWNWIDAGRAMGISRG